MAIPASVKKCLEEQSVNYDLAAAGLTLDEVQPTSEVVIHPSQKAKLIILQDSIGLMQVLIPADSLLDLSHLCELLGRNLQAINDDELSKLLKPLSCQNLPGVPQLTGLDTVVEQSLLEKDQLYVDSGNDDVLIKLDKVQLRQITGKAKICTFTHKVERIQHQIDIESTEEDEKQITRAVQKFTSLRIKQRLVNTLEIPPMPDSAEKIIKLRVDPNAGIGELAKVVETDPSLAAQVVSWAASPFYAAPGKITSVHDAVVRVLGFDLVINLALGLALGRTLELPSDGPRGVTPYWQQAVYSATTMEAVVKVMNDDVRPSMGMAYLSGLLNNFGYLILAHVFPPHFSLISRYMEANPEIDHQIIEHHLIRVSREQIASWLMSAWNMPEEVVTALRWQTDPSYQGKHANYANLLYLVNQLLRERGIGTGPMHVISDSYFKRLGLNRDTVAEAVDSVMARKNHILAMAKNLSF